MSLANGSMLGYCVLRTTAQAMKPGHFSVQSNGSASDANTSGGAGMIHVSVNFIAPPAIGRPDPLDRLLTATWLRENARHISRMDDPQSERLHVVFVGCTERLSPTLLEELGAVFIVSCETNRYERLATEYGDLIASLGGAYTVFSFGFLRWLLIEELFDGSPVLCYDGDILHNVPLGALSRAFQGSTRTATSTAFASISSPDWFKGWRRNLALLNRDPAAFLSRHVSKLPYGMASYRASPEEYFAKFLIEAGEIPQDELGQDFPFWIVPQPHLLPRLYNFVETRASNAIPTPMKYNRIWGTDTLNGRSLAFWHMQKPFMSQLSALAVIRESDPRLDPGQIYPFNHYGSVGRDEKVRYADPYHARGGYSSVPDQLSGLARALIAAEKANAEQRVPPERNFFHPAFLYDYYFRKFDMSPLFNNRRWPKPNCWTGT